MSGSRPRNASRRARPPVLVLALALAAAGAGRARAQEVGPAADPATLEGRPIRRIEIDTRGVFGTDSASALDGFYRFAERLHIRTRPGTVRHLLLLREGRSWSARRAEESGRVLRSSGFLEPVLVEGRPAGDSVDVKVVTRDEWSTDPQFSLAGGGDRIYGTIGISEDNLLGLGKSFGFFYREDPAGISRGIRYDDPALLGTQVRLHYLASDGSAGAVDELGLEQPFFSQESRWRAGGAWRRVADRARLYQEGEEAAVFDRRLDDLRFWLGAGHGTDGQVLRATALFVSRTRYFGPSETQPGAPPAFGGPADSLTLRGPGLELEWWRPRFVSRRGLEEVGRIKDYDLGPSLRLLAEGSLRSLGGTNDEALVRADASLGAAAGAGFVLGEVGVRSRISSEGALETIGAGDLRWRAQSMRGHSFVAAVNGVASHRPARDFQVRIGGLNGLRAYPVWALTGTEAVRLNVEQRWWLKDDVAGVLSLGTVVFYDAARVWGPGAEDSPWHHGGGVGLRFGAPRAALGPTLRLDLAWPVSPTVDGRRDPALTFSTGQAF